MNRRDVLSEALEKCLKELYSLAQPKVEWDDFLQQNKNWKEGDPRPYEMYYLPQDICKEIVEDYVYAYNMNDHCHDHFDVLINFFNDPVIEVYDKELGRHYEHQDSLKNIIGEESFKKIEEYVKMAKDFYNRNWELSSFNMSVYLGPSPNSNKEKVIENWKKYRNIDIKIDESVYKEDEE